MIDPSPESFLPLAPADLQLLLATAREPMHGYAMMKAVETQSRGALRVELGSLYRMIQRLERDGLMEVAPGPGEDRSPGRERRYYQITNLGRSVVSAELSRLRDVLEIAAEMHPREAR